MRFNVYGHFDVILHVGPDGWWIAEQVGDDGKRRFLPDVVLDPDIDPEAIPGQLEAVFHESARPGAKIVRVG
jgi:hypothetical protein